MGGVKATSGEAGEKKERTQNVARQNQWLYVRSKASTKECKRWGELSNIHHSYSKQLWHIGKNNK